MNYFLHLHMALLIIGLGNPGITYQNTRHNAGFLAVDRLAAFYSLSFVLKKKFHCEITDGTHHRKLILVKPTTYMNLSGNAAFSIQNYYNIPLENVYVIHDDIDLELGKIKYKFGGGSGGHNGLRSCNQIIGSQYHRIRIGIGRPKCGVDVADYVLDNFTQLEHRVLNLSIDRIIDNFELLLEYKTEIFKNKISSMQQS